MKNEHHIIYRHQEDPPGILIVAVRHTTEEAQAALESAAADEAQRVNASRTARFKRGGECGREVSAADFTHTYITAHVIEVS